MNTTQQGNPSRKIEWINSRGQTVTALLSIHTTEIAYADGCNVEVPCCEWRERVELDGVFAACAIDRISPPRKATGGVMVAGRADRIGIPVEQMDRIDAARAELRAEPVWVEHEAQTARNRAEAAEYDRGQRAMSGWCDRCQSCCYGDCQS
jgi:hypothetical protein